MILSLTTVSQIISIFNEHNGSYACIILIFSCYEGNKTDHRRWWHDMHEREREREREIDVFFLVLI